MLTTVTLWAALAQAETCDEHAFDWVAVARCFETHERSDAAMEAWTRAFEAAPEEVTVADVTPTSHALRDDRLLVRVAARSAPEALTEDVRAHLDVARGRNEVPKGTCQYPLGSYRLAIKAARQGDLKGAVQWYREVIATGSPGSAGPKWVDDATETLATAAILGTASLLFRLDQHLRGQMTMQMAVADAFGDRASVGAALRAPETRDGAIRSPHGAFLPELRGSASEASTTVQQLDAFVENPPDVPWEMQTLPTDLADDVERVHSVLVAKHVHTHALVARGTAAVGSIEAELVDARIARIEAWRTEAVVHAVESHRSRLVVATGGEPSQLFWESTDYGD